MKQYLYRILSTSVIVLSFAACRDCYYIENDFHGMWQVASVERFSTGEMCESQGNLYFMFQRTMVLLYYKHPYIHTNKSRYISHIDIVEPDRVEMGNFRLYTTGEGDFVNQEVNVSLEDLHKFGLFQDYTKFHFNLSKQKLILTSDSACITLRKY